MVQLKLTGDWFAKNNLNLFSTDEIPKAHEHEYASSNLASHHYQVKMWICHKETREDKGERDKDCDYCSQNC